MSTSTRAPEITSGNDAAANTLRALVAYRGLNASKLAAMSGIEYETVRRYVKGESNLTVGYLEVFAKALGVPRYVLAMDAGEAMVWVTENAPNGSLAATAGTITTRRYSASDQPELPFPPDVIDLRDCVTGRGAVVTGRAVVTGFGTTLDAA